MTACLESPDVRAISPGLLPSSPSNRHSGAVARVKPACPAACTRSKMSVTDGRISRENVWLDGGAIAAQLAGEAHAAAVAEPAAG